jgi:hypothetical protein
MLVVRVEIWPGGDSRAQRQIEALTIVNVGLAEPGWHAYETRHDGRLAHVRHRQVDGALVLVARAIHALGLTAEIDVLAAPDPDDPPVGEGAKPDLAQAASS